MTSVGLELSVTPMVSRSAGAAPAGVHGPRSTATARRRRAQRSHLVPRAALEGREPPGRGVPPRAPTFSQAAYGIRRASGFFGRPFKDIRQALGGSDLVSGGEVTMVR